MTESPDSGPDGRRESDSPSPDLEARWWRKWFRRFIGQFQGRDATDESPDASSSPGEDEDAEEQRATWPRSYYFRRAYRTPLEGVEFAPIPLFSSLFGGLDVFTIPIGMTGGMTLPPRHREGKPKHYLWKELKETDSPEPAMVRRGARVKLVADSVAKSKISWLWPRYAAIVLVTAIALGLTFNADQDVSVALVVALELLVARTAWSYTYSYWWGNAFDYTKQRIYLHSGVFRPKSVGSVGGESISEVRGERYVWANWFGLDIGWIEVNAESRTESLRFKHVPNWTRVKHAIDVIDEAGGQGPTQAHTRLSAKGAFMRGDISVEDVAEELGEETARTWSRQKAERGHGSGSPEGWPVAPDDRDERDDPDDPDGEDRHWPDG